MLEDPATGAAAAVFLRNLGWPHGGYVMIRQGEDMGAPSEIDVTVTEEAGAPVRVAGYTRTI